MQVGDLVTSDLIDGQTQLQVDGLYGEQVLLLTEQGAWARAVRPGVVEQVALGTTPLIVRADDETRYFYGGLESPNVHEQQRVTEGRTLGQVGLGGSGLALLWFGVRGPDGVEVDPTPYLTFSVAVAADSEPMPQEAITPPPPDQGATADGVVVDEASSPSGHQTDAAAATLRAAGWTVEPPVPPGL